MRRPSVMKKEIFMALLIAFLPACLGINKLISNHISVLSAAEKKVRTSVTGSGKTRSEAESEAAKAARQISFSYSVISKNTTGSGTNYVCTMVIEYTQK